MEPLARRRLMFRMVQMIMLVLLGVFFLIAALAQPVFASTHLGWGALVAMVVCAVGLWWAGRQADRRG